MIRVGYACIALGAPETKLRSCVLKNATPQKLFELTLANLRALGHILDYNIRNRIELFRVSSDIVPFASHPEISVPWKKEFTGTLAALGKKARDAGLRLSFHPGQYTVLNSPDARVVERAVMDLRYHCDFLDLLGMDGACKIVLHIGGAYGDKAAAAKRFVGNYRALDERIRKRLVVENDDKLYNICDVLAIGEEAGIPVVFDYLHNLVNPGERKKDEETLMKACAKTWRARDGRPKIHYSQQESGKKPGSHSDTIDAALFLDFTKKCPDNTDIMLEVKDKNLSAKKCILCMDRNGSVGALEREWARYKYAVLEHSPDAYQKIRTLLKDKDAYPAIEFYRLIDDAMKLPPDTGTRVNTARHIWGYFRKNALPDEKKQFLGLLERFANGAGSIAPVKKFLLRLSQKYGREYLLASYYFL